MSTPASLPGAQRYLVVDDHEGFRRMIREFLPDEVGEFIECRDGAAAVAAYGEHHPDWTIMDIQMPGLDGLAATRAICERFRGAQIIILSQHDSPELRQEARAAGACGYLSKDRLPELACLIRTLACKSPLQPEVPL